MEKLSTCIYNVCIKNTTQHMTDDVYSTLIETTDAMMAEGKGLLAADESTGSITKRFDALGIESNEENRRRYREVLFTTPNIEKYISGVILYDETIRQSASDGTPFPQLLQNRGILPGIKVDMGAKPLAFSEGEFITEGLDGLRERLEEYASLGAKFAKWRAVISIDPENGMPSDYAVKANAEALARYATLCQEQGIVPIVEPEVLWTNPESIGTESMTRDEALAITEEVTLMAIKMTFDALFDHNVIYEGMILKPNMITSGDLKGEDDPELVAELTLGVLYRTVPAAVPGIAFLSGGQPDVAAAHHLSLMNQLGDHPWEMTYSFGRALHQSTLEVWKGSDENKAAAQTEFEKRCAMNSKARLGEYTPDMG